MNQDKNILNTILLAKVLKIKKPLNKQQLINGSNPTTQS